MTAPWNILHLDLSEDLPSLPRDPGAGGLYVVFWWHGLPLGRQEIAAAQLPMPAAQVEALALRAVTPAVGDHLLTQGFAAPLPVKHPPPQKPPDAQALLALEHPLAALREKMAFSSVENAGAGPSVSVVVCTRDRAEPLARCLRSLRNLSHAPHEILIVDNAPRTDAVRRLVRQMPGVRYAAEPRPGLSAARNTGIRRTTGEIIAFTDDDVVVHPDWTRRLLRGFDAPGVWAVTGLVLPAELKTRAQLRFEQSHAGFGWGFRRLLFDDHFFEQMKSRGVPVWQIGAGANMAFRRETFERVGLFDERLGAGASGCSEDSELWYRVLAEGGQCRYEPTAVVHHHHRREMDALRRQMYQYMRGHVAALLIQFEKYGHGGNLRRAFLTLPRYYARRWLQRTRRTLRGASDPGTLDHEMRGYAAGLAYYLRHRHTAPTAQRPAAPTSPDPETPHA